MGLALILIGLLLWLLAGWTIIGLILIVLGIAVLVGGFGTGRRYY